MEGQRSSLPRAVQSGKPGHKQIGVGKVAKEDGSLISFSKWETITPRACTQTTFCGMKSDSKLPVKSDTAKWGEEGHRGMVEEVEKLDLLRYI